MAKAAPLGQQLYVHGFDLSGDVGSFSELNAARQVLDVTPINKSARERLIGRTDGVIDFDSFFNDATGAQLAALKTLPTTDLVAIWCKGSTLGDAAAAIIAKQINLATARAADGALTMQARLEAAGFPLEFGEMLTAGIDTHSSATTGASVDDNGAATSDGISAYLIVNDIGSGTPTLKIEMDTASHFPRTTTLITFSAVADGNEPTGERKTATGTVERYLRLVSTGTFTDFDFAVFIRRGTAQDIAGIIT